MFILIVVSVVFAATATSGSQSGQDANSACAGCEYNNAGAGYLQHPDNCHEYIQCQQTDDNTYIGYEMYCRQLFWNQAKLSCDITWDGEVPCLNDSCVVVEKIECKGGDSDEEDGGGDDGSDGKEAAPCALFPVDGDRSKYIVMDNNKKVERPCPAGTVFSKEHCTCALYEGSDAITTPCENDPKLNFPFNDHFDDVSCNKAVGTEFGEPELEDGVLSLDGSSKIEVDFLINYFGTTPSAAFTVSLWFKQDDDEDTDQQGLLGNGDCNTESSWLMSVKNKQFEGKLLTDAGSYTISGPSITRSEWMSVVMVYNSWSVKLYANGRFEKGVTASGAIKNSPAPMNIGMAYILCDAKFFKGSIAGVRFYSRAVYDEEIKEIYDEGYQPDADK